LRGPRQHPPRRRVPRDGPHAGPGRAAGTRRASDLTGVRLGVCILPELRWPEQRRLWQRAEELGFDHAWTYDHLAWRSLRDGPWYSAREAQTSPGCVEQPRVPFAIAATGRRGMRLAATYADTWVTTGDRTGVGDVAAVGDQIKRLEDACQSAGRDPSTIDRLV